MNTEQQPAATQDVYTIVTTSIIAQLEQGIIPWYAAFKEAGLPKNLVSGMPYSGLNVWLLSSLGYPQNLFLTFKQVRTLGGSVKKGEKGHIAVYWVAGKKEPSFRYYKVFNVTQCENIPEERMLPIDTVANPIALCSVVADAMLKPPEIKRNEGATLYYAPDTDCIHLPQDEYFHSDALYYSSLFYALVMSTGHTSRLHRLECMERKPLGPKLYSMEELLCEMASSYLCSFAGIDALYPSHDAEDVEGWLNKLHADSHFVVTASMQAQKAINHVLHHSGVNGTGQVGVAMPEMM